MKSDQELMIAYISGDQQAFSELYTRYKPRVYGYLSQKVAPTERDDLFQSVFMKLHHKKHLFKPEYAFAPWFFTLIKHEIIDVARRNSKRTTEPLFEEQHFQDDQTGQSDSVEKIESLNLNEQDQKLLYLKFVEGKGYQELELEFSSKAATLRKRVSRLLEKLKWRDSHE
ncbi:MAG: hypothetical protein COW00_11045 [Bdellovibrio sp. CG12_big_fil_rev_8_21_14_0_65_39_13]|nr:MAG: hypothetical protein COW78_16400 [Bdellovibrio sp. CG22_combo_CG10-13_8_21_14_all_39_27]PIQ59257.1 MAG: hypothetical protein COW00_11045 [Bdellovibrio sp. CG12_big_fil_rev_8_21_14_0_65_39_13]PIR32268.1 MAG: hypothetical protein COV37_20335 [Bdellovibrio sp. CG11_big_fil_rev_8_21_14_0_20_39_38]